MDFLNWVFNDHWILSLFFIPGMQMLWSYYYGLKFRLVISVLYFCFLWGSSIFTAVFKKR